MHLMGSWQRSLHFDPTSIRDFSFFKLHNSNAVTVLENDRRRLVYQGIIFDATNCQLLHNPGLLDRAFGFYTYILFEKGTGAIDVGADRLGYSPVYYAWENGIFRFSSSLTLLKYQLSTATPNLDAWEESLVLGDILGDKTVVREINRLRWGRKFRMTADRVDSINIWEPEVPALTDRQTYIDQNNELLIEAMKLTQSADRRKFVMLSGGQDSRRLAVAAHRLDIPITCVTQEACGKDDTDKDVLLAKAVCELLGVPLLRVPLASNQEAYNDSILKNYWLGHETAEHDWVLPMLRRVPKGALMYDGIVADVTVNGHYFRMYPELVQRFGDIDYAARLLCGNRRSPIAPRLVSAPLFERVREELARYPNSPHRLTYYFLLNHTRRSIGSWFALFYVFGHTPCLPYIYYPFFIQSLSLEPKHYFDAWMQNECLKAMNPEAAALPSTRTKVPADYVIDLTSEVRARSQFEARHLWMRRDAGAYLPGFNRSLNIFKAMSALGLRELANRWSWAPQTLMRFSEFLDWIEDHTIPEFPVQRETNEFLDRHFIK